MLKRRKAQSNRIKPDRPRGIPKWGLRLGSLVVFAFGWELLARNLNSLLMPTFTETMAALAGLLAGRALWQALWISNQALGLGFAFAAVAGVLLGLLMSRFRSAERLIDPYLSILLVTPMSALIPIVIIATGLGLISRVIVVFSFAVVMIAVHTRAGVRMVDRGLIEMAHAFGATEGQLWRKVLVRGALPPILTGLRLGFLRAVSGMITVELVLVAVGVGRLMLDFQGNFEAASLYAAVLVVVAEACIAMQLAQRFERRVTPWADQVGIE